MFILAFLVFVSFEKCDLYGVALCACGMLSNMATGLTIDAYGPVCDNAGGIAEMAGQNLPLTLSPTPNPNANPNSNLTLTLSPNPNPN